MRPILPILAILGPALHAAAPDEALKKLPAVSLLPNGSELHGVMIPRHDENHNLVGSLKADKITLVNSQTIAGEQVVIDFFHDNGNPRGQISLTHALVNQLKGLLTSKQAVAIDTETFHARGSGLLYAIQDGEGFLQGPATTWIETSPKTTMKSKHSSLIGATGIALISQSIAVTGQEPEPPTTKGSVMVRTVKSEAEEAREAARRALEQSQARSEAASAASKAFVEQATDGRAVETTAAEGHDKPLDVAIGPQDTVVSCDGGMYFNADKGLLVYQGNVQVSDPRFTLTGADELKIFLSAKDKSEPTNGQAGAVSRFDQVQRITATGAVRIVQRAVEEGKQPVEASGAVFDYQPATGEILLSGGYPWVMQGSNFMRAKSPNLTLRIQKSGSFVTEGNWEMGGRLKSN